MTREHLSEAQLIGYSGRTLDPDELLAVDRHLASCDVCHERLRRMWPDLAKQTTHFESGEESAEAPFHLDYAQHLEPYVDGKASDIDREIIESHLALCSKCSDDLEDLREFKEHAVPAIAGVAHTSSRWKQLVPHFSWASTPVWATAVLAIAILTLAAAVVMWTRSGPVQQVEIVPPELEKHADAAESQQPSPAPAEHPGKQDPSSVPAGGANAQPAPTEQPLVALYDAGGQLILSQSGRLEGLDGLPADLRESIERTLVTRRLRASPALTGWSKDTNTLRSEIELQNTFAPLDPTGVVIETDRPTFRWRGLEGAQHYVVTVYDAKLRKVSNSDPISGTEWTTPNSLERGVTYSWQISALKDGDTVVTPKPPLPEARFRVLDQQAIGALAKLKEFAGTSHLALAVFYWKHGLIEASEREFQELANANPNSSVVTELLASIRALRRR